MLRVNMDDGGTNAGCRLPLKEKPKPWSCCGKELGGHWSRCPECKSERP